NDPCWVNSIPLSNFYQTFQSKPAKVKTTAYICYDSDNIYIAFVNNEPYMDKIKAKLSERDSSVWNDDCNEIFLTSPDGKIRQFVVNASNAKADVEIYMKVPGNPYEGNLAWNGQWESAVKRNANSWTTEVAIPFNNFKHAPNGLWRINLARERHGANRELVQWNRVEGSFSNANKFGFLEFSKDTAILTRFVEPFSETPLHIVREDTKFKELLSEEAGNYIVGSWAHSTSLDNYPKIFQAKYSQENWREEQQQILMETGEAGMFGFAFPWVEKHIGGMDKIREFNRKYGIKFSLAAKSSLFWGKAVKNGAVYLCDKGNIVIPDPTDPALANVEHTWLENYLKSRPDIVPYLAVINGEDEPTNTSYDAFSFTKNSRNKKSLEILDAKIKQDYGFGKFGLYDYYADAKSERQSEFNHIAFWSWWSEEYCKVRRRDREILNKFAPDVPYLVNFNSCSTFRYLDLTRISFILDYISCDPYPTATLALHGRDRALYHTGFSTKLVNDMAVPGVKTCVMPQGFIYHSRGPTPEDIREWASQAMKNGASMLYWYSAGPLRVTIPDSYKEMLRINKLVHSMKKIKFPQKTATALFFAQAARRGIMDEAQYSLYTLYVLLGEKLKSWFRIVNETMLELNVDSLDSYRLVYVPELKYVDSATAEKLLKFVEKGGILVLFDPESFTWNVDGTRMNDFRSKIVGAPIGKVRKTDVLSVSEDYLKLKKGDKLSLSKVRGRKEAGNVLAFDVLPPEDANVFATYEDGKPAAYERTIGKGKVIYFAAQPFGSAQLATRESSWGIFLSGLAKEVGEPENLDIWDFHLPVKGGEVEVKYIINPK
ncbi:MAG: beta-galactosidase trimerization domain-containing protein, partial [Victivallaceae bacterium]|nr:beta-galactosidase trimerization domain-containing protein [Victivallaceae bacterium]